MNKPIFDIELIRKAVKNLRELEPACMQWIIWVDHKGVHRKFYGHRQRLARKRSANSSLSRPEELPKYGHNPVSK